MFMCNNTSITIYNMHHFYNGYYNFDYLIGKREFNKAKIEV